MNSASSHTFLVKAGEALLRSAIILSYWKRKQKPCAKVLPSEKVIY